MIAASNALMAILLATSERGMAPAVNLSGALMHLSYAERTHPPYRLGCLEVSHSRPALRKMNKERWAFISYKAAIVALCLLPFNVDAHRPICPYDLAQIEAVPQGRGGGSKARLPERSLVDRYAGDAYIELDGYPVLGLAVAGRLEDFAGVAAHYGLAF